MNLFAKVPAINNINIPAYKKTNPGEEFAHVKQTPLFENGIPDYIKRSHSVVNFNYSKIDSLKVKIIENKDMVQILGSIIKYVDSIGDVSSDEGMSNLVDLMKEEIEIVSFANNCRASIIAL